MKPSPASWGKKGNSPCAAKRARLRKECWHFRLCDLELRLCALSLHEMALKCEFPSGSVVRLLAIAIAEADNPGGPTGRRHISNV